MGTQACEEKGREVTDDAVSGNSEPREYVAFEDCPHDNIRQTTAPEVWVCQGCGGLATPRPDQGEGVFEVVDW